MSRQQQIRPRVYCQVKGVVEMHRAQVEQTTVSIKAFFGAAESKGFAQGQYPLVCVRLLDKKVSQKPGRGLGFQKLRRLRFSI